MSDLVKTSGGPLAPAATPPKPVVVYLQGHPAMRPNLSAVLRVLEAEPDLLAFPWEQIRYEHMETIRAKLIGKYAPASARKCIVAIRGVLKTAWKMRLLDRETYERTIDVDAISGDGEPAGRMLSPAEVRALLEAAESPRDAAIVALGVYAGLRRVELSRLDLADLDGFQKVVIRKGKGRKFREVFIPPEAEAHLAPWLAARGRDPGPLFAQSRRGGHFTRSTRLSVSGVWRAISEVAEAAKIEITPHDLRRTYASTLLDRKVDLVTVQKLMGHSAPTTTAKYDRRGDAPKIDAAAKLAEAFRKES